MDWVCPFQLRVFNYESMHINSKSNLFDKKNHFLFSNKSKLIWKLIKINYIKATYKRTNISVGGITVQLIPLLLYPEWKENYGHGLIFS